MSARLANKSQFSFKGVTYAATAVSVESPSAEIVDITTASTPLGKRQLMATGDVASAGRVSVDALGFADPSALVGQSGDAVFTTPVGSVTQKVICESASVDGRVADLLRIRLSLVMTSDPG
jgi:hypothetical protein